LRQKSGEFVDQDVFDLVCLLDLDAYADTVDRGLDEHTFVLIARNRQWRQQNLRGGLSFYLRDIVALCSLGCEVGEAEGGCETTPDSLEVWPERLGLGNDDVSMRTARHWECVKLTIVLFFQNRCCAEL
jgi:hypothetical protein